MNTLSVLDSGVVGETVFVLLPRPLGPRVSDPIFPVGSLDLLVLSTLRGECGPSLNVNPFDGLSEIVIIIFLSILFPLC